MTMNVEYHTWWSPHLGQDMALKVYGHAGRPMLVFPAQGGRFYEFEDFGMIEACRAFVEGGQIQVFTVDSIDHQSWTNWNAPPAERARRHEDYDRYVVQEVAPFVRRRAGNSRLKLLTAGVSMGGYHAGNFFFRHPDLFDGVICMSGLFQLSMFIGDYNDETVYLNSPLHDLPHLDDPWYLEQYRRSHIVVCAGQGAWEEPMLADARALQSILEAKGVPAWIDIWGPDVNHDWPWWRKMLPYFLGQIT
jgi:esterase/lipase superfamily enzyme